MFDDSSKSKQELFPKNMTTQFGNNNSCCASVSQQNSGLLRFRSAPSSLLENFIHGVEKSSGSGQRFDLCGENGSGLGLVDNNNNNNSFDGLVVNGVSCLPPQYPRQSSNTQLVDDVFGSNLMRQNSSPPGLFSNLSPQNGHVAMKGVVGNRYRTKSPLSYSSSSLHSSLGVLSQITEVENESNVETIPDNDEKLRNGNSSDTQFYGSDYPFASWSDSPNYIDNLNGLKRELVNDANLFATVKSQVGDNIGTRPQTLTHHLSLPNCSAEFAAIEKVSQFPDTVPWKIRAKRGCATHPRSIAERVRRTRISERMRKLQDLVPNMDKQSNTADMLDFAVEYIKDLQRQYKTLTDCRANCKCSAMHKLASNQRI